MNIFKTVKIWRCRKKECNPGKSHAAGLQQCTRYSAYIWSTLQGTNPPNAKEPQGEIWTGEEG